MRKCLLIISLIALLLPGVAFPQNPGTSCGQKEVTDRLFNNNPHLKVFQQQIEKQLQVHAQKVKQGLEQPYQPNAIVTLPVVVHIIHNNGTENISDAQVFTAIQHLNEAFANTGYYDPSDGVNTEIQFCLAQRDPNNNPTNGIDRIVSPLTVMDGWNNGAQDIAVKNLSRWDPRCYINIWIVREITGPVAGYAYLPSAHGMNIDGIVGEAAYFGSSNANDVLIIHEMGHYLGLYHTFQGGCTNNDCAKDGDQVCDTPPDQSTAGISCNSTANSCSTDALSGFSTDVNDLHKDYLDYGNWNCMKVFTQGQATRMNWMIQNVRKSLLDCKSCLSPCPAPVTPNFNSSGNNVPIGTTVNFTNSSVNASGYKWYINNTLQTTTTNFSHTFNTIGTFIIKLSALTSNPLCDSAVTFDTVKVTCPVTAGFSPLFTSINTNNTVNFSNSSTGATLFSWSINGVPQSTSTNFSNNFTLPGTFNIKLVSSNGTCTDSIEGIVNVKDSCSNTMNFQKMFDGGGTDAVFDLKTTKDGGSIAAGYFNSGLANSTDALLIKTDSLGNTEWSRGYTAGEPDIFRKVIETADGGYIAIGETTLPVAGKISLYIVKVASNGTIMWSRLIRTTTTSEERGLCITQLPDGSFIFGGSSVPFVAQQLNIIVGKLDVNGNLLWLKILNNSRLNHLWDIMYDNNTVVANGYSSMNGKTLGILIKLDAQNGNLIWGNLYEDVAGDVTFGQIEKSGNEYAISSFGNPYHHLIRTDLNGNIVSKISINPFSSEILSRAFLDKNNNWITFQTQKDAGSKILKMQKITSTGVIHWSSRTPVPNFPSIAAIAKPAENNPWVAFNMESSGGNSDLVIARLDGLGCNGAQDDIRLAQTTFITSTINWQAIADTSTINPFFGNTQSFDKTFNVFVICTNNPCVNPPPVDTCGSITFQKKIGGTGIDHAFDIKALANNEYVIAGSTTSTPGTGNNEEALLIKLNNKGNILWQKSIGGFKKDQYTKIVVNAAGEYLVFGKTESQHNANGSMLLTKFDANGVILWAKEYNFTNASLTSFENVTGAIELSNGEIAFCANANGINTDVGQPLPATFNIIGVLSNTGTLKWVKRFREYYTESGGAVTGITSMNDALFITSSYGIMKMSVADGTLMGLQKKFQNFGTLNSIEPYGSQLMVYSQIHQLVFDQNLNLVSAQMMLPQEPGYLLSTNGFSSENGTAIQGNYFKMNADYSVFLSRFNAASNYRWNYRYPYPSTEYRGLSGSRNTIDNGVVSIGTRYRKLSDISNEPADIFILRTDSLGRIPDCPRASFVPGLLPVQGIFIELHARTYPISTQIFDLSLLPLNPQLTVQSLCATEDCSTLILSAKDTVCSFSDTVQIKAYKDSACDAFSEWIVDTTVAKIISQNDTLLKLQFKRSGVFTIYARLTGGCRLLQDSVTLTVFNSPDSINLGPDIQLCKISTYTFNARTGFKSYQWQDGSMDSTLTIYYPGTYHVTAEDYCGNLYRDTVVVSQSPDIPFDLGPDLAKCNNDTLTITAPVGFNKYYWSPGYRVDSLYSRIIKVSPDRDTTYIVIAEKAPGCLVTDSIRVMVNRSIPLQLGNDTSFCQTDSITISANAGFNSYQWNTGANAQSIRVKVAGLYYVSATDSNGCISKDSIEINPLYTLPAVNIGADFSICRNTIHEFDAGNFTTYLWQDGSVDRRFRSSQTGTYWVRVSDANGCVNQDTATIIGYLESPRNFLDSSADICEGQLLEIKAAVGYSRYRWFNNSSSSTINITAPGIYWVEVTNAEGCTIRDSISVKAKDCVKGIFFPNAFTPSNGGKNNFFRPVVNGQLESFQLIVYNRYGQKVFETRDAYKGWDGRINGVIQTTNTFTWSAIYKFSGASEKQQTAKGTVTVIR